MALAQTVAGVRQYTQLISLMDNYDTFKNNVSVATESEGTLTEQQKIYAESWEAASDRVKAAAQGVYDSILDDEFFIKLTDGFAKALEAVEGLMDGFGGLKGILMSVGSIILTTYANKMPATLNNLK
jgi:hypothetical protein